MRRLIYGVLTSLVIVSAAMPAGAEPPITIAQQDSTLQQMYRQQRVLTDDMRTIMAQMQTMMAQMKALMSLPEGNPTMTDLYKQQQVILAQMDRIIGRSRLDTLPPQQSTATIQEVYQQQQLMLAEMKGMMAEMQKMIEVYRGRVSTPKR